MSGEAYCTPPRDRTQVLLEGVVQKMSTIFRTSQTSLSFLRPDGELEIVVRNGIDEDPMALSTSSEGKPLGSSLVEAGKLRLELRGTRSPLGDAIEKAGPHCVAVLALPLQTPARPLGLLVFYLPEEASIPTEFEMEHLERMALGLTLTLEAASEAASTERLEAITKSALAGQLAQRVFRSAEGPIDRMVSSVYRLRSRPGSPQWLTDGLAEIEDTVFHLQKMGRALAAFGEEDLPPMERLALTNLLAEIEKDFRVPLARGRNHPSDREQGRGKFRACRAHLVARAHLGPRRERPLVSGRNHFGRRGTSDPTCHQIRTYSFPCSTTPLP